MLMLLDRFIKFECYRVTIMLLVVTKYSMRDLLSLKLRYG